MWREGNLGEGSAKAVAHLPVGTGNWDVSQSVSQ